MKRYFNKLASIITVLFLVSACAAPQHTTETVRQQQTLSQEAPASTLPEFEPVESSILDNGRMWTFEYAPVDYFAETYNFDPDSAWFEHARMSAVRIPGCSGSFVSNMGLVMTNHHCARSSITQIGMEGENTLDNGFYASTLSDERKIEDYYVDQLVEIRDVTDRILSDVDAVPVENRAEARQQAISRVQSEISEEVAEYGDRQVQVVSLFNGGRYSAYIFRRFTDVRMVMAPELQIGYFGGDSDNFTYPRYNLDMTFYRVYVDDEPYQPEFYFPFSETGAEEGDGVFMIGNPGRTTRLNTVSQLAYSGTYDLPFRHSLFTRLIEGLEAYFDYAPESPEAQQLRNTIFGLKNSQKLLSGQIEAHNNEYLMGRKVDNQQKFRDALNESPELRDTYIPIIDRIAEIQEEKAALAPYPYITLGIAPNSIASAAILQRGYFYAMMEQIEDNEQRKSSILNQIQNIQDKPPFLEKQLIISHLNYLADGLGTDHPYLMKITNGQDYETVADNLIENSGFATAEKTDELLESSESASSDPAVAYFKTFGETLFENIERFRELSQEESELQTRLGRGWFAVYGTSIPPDATFSPRIQDGVVNGYEYNGTVAPAYTTFYGMYDRHYSHTGEPEWDLPERWATPSSSLDLSTPVNFVSTNDIIGGNSGSPVVNIDLEVVGLAFDGNVESMGSSTFILDDRSARAVSVDVRGMLESLRNVYNATRIVEELENARN
ncbi:S46 family peptidase [Rhodohalobacter mucosus]|uniref:Dipeptidyl-peptidase n=1 Tax=Rhodohalobacter mucosus TaxID=2079485 RepID=A0A316U3P2_9BACT|nr:S46 family peptidase [Rhodohalobacter mucosus]PWN08096.1 S46 family peptidase [Rhodohalobacter mucosus]